MTSPTNSQKIPRSVWTSSYLSAVLAVILVAEVMGLGAYIYYRVQRVLQPENVADRVEAAIRENYPDLREELLTQVKAGSPEIAEQVSQEIIASTPEARQQLERFTARQLEVGLDQVTEISAEQFRELLEENRESVTKAFERVEAAPDEARELILETEANIEEQLGISIQEQAKTVLAIHRELNEKLEHLNNPRATLQPRELLERRIVRILRTMQEEESGTDRFVGRDIPTDAGNAQSPKKTLR